MVVADLPSPMAASAAAASVVAVALSLPSLPPVDDVFAGAADASDWVCVESAGGGAPFGAAGVACEAELFGPPAAVVLVVALLADWALVLPPVAALEDVPPAFAGGELFGAALRRCRRCTCALRRGRV